MKHPPRSSAWALALCASLTAACGASTVSTVGDEPPGDDPASLFPVVPPSRITGEVYLTQWQETPQARPLAGAAFWQTGGRSIARGCRISGLANCELRRCAPGVEREPTPEDAVASAGEMHLEGLAGGPLMFRPGAAGAYRLVRPDALAEGPRAWTGGELLTLRADGDPRGAPSFTLHLRAPDPIAVTSPRLDGRRLARGVDGLELDWTGGGDDMVRVQVGNSSAGGETVRLRCDYPASDGHASVSAEVLALVPGAADVYVMTVAPTRIVNEDLDVLFSLKHVGRADSISVE